MPRKQSKRILLVEDDATYRHLWKRLIEDMGFRNYRTAATAEEAATILSRKKIDLLISDVVLPGMNGYELAKIARRQNPSMPILLNTGYGTDLSRFDLVGLQLHLLHKPFHSLKDVCTLLQRLLVGEDVFEGMDEDSFSENIDHPQITEWTL